MMKTDAAVFRLPRAALTITAAALMLAGCGSITGLIDAQDQFGCPMTGGVTCQTVSQTFESEHAREDAERRPHGLHRTELSGAGSRPEAAAPDQTTPAVAETLKRRLREQTAAQQPSRSPLKIDARIPRQFTGSARLSARAPERVLMLWILPWVDDSGDLHDASRVWMRVEDASWRIERVRSRTVNGAAPRVEP